MGKFKEGDLKRIHPVDLGDGWYEQACIFCDSHILFHEGDYIVVYEDEEVNGQICAHCLRVHFPHIGDKHGEHRDGSA